MTPRDLDRLAHLERLDLDRHKWPEVAARLQAELETLRAMKASRPAADPAALLNRARARAHELGVDL